MKVAVPVVLQALLAAGATATAAAALRREKRLGRIETGMDADLVVLDVPTVDEWLSEVGRSSVRAVLKRGRVVHESPLYHPHE